MSFLERLLGKSNEKEPEPDPEPPVYVVDKITVQVISDLSPDGDPRATVRVKDFELIIVVHGEKILENLARDMNWTLARDYKKWAEERVREELCHELMNGNVSIHRKVKLHRDVFVP